MRRFKFSKLSRSARRLRKELTSCMRGESTDCDSLENAPERLPTYPSPATSVTSFTAPIPPLPSTSPSSKECCTDVAEGERNGDLSPKVDKPTDEEETTSSPKSAEVSSVSDDAVTTSEIEECEQRSFGNMETECSLEETKVPSIADEDEKSQSETKAGNSVAESQEPPVSDDIEEEKIQSEVEADNTSEEVQEPLTADDMDSTAIIQIQEFTCVESFLPEAQVCSLIEVHPESVKVQMKSDAEEQVEETSTGTSVNPTEENEHDIMSEEKCDYLDQPLCTSDSGSIPECENDGCVEGFVTPQESDSGHDVLSQDMRDGQCAEDIVVDQTDGAAVRSTSSIDLLEKMLEQTEKQKLCPHQSLMNVPQQNIVRGQRSDTSAFELKLVRGFLGLGLTLGSNDFKEVAVQKIGLFSPAATQGGLRVGDRILKINDHSVIGKGPSQAQRMLGEVKWGEEVHIVAMPPQDTVIFRWVEEMNAGIITMKLNTCFDNPLGIEVEGGSDTESPYICVKYIKPGSVADKCGLLKTGDELVQIDDHPMVGMTHFEAVDVIGHIYKPITITVQRREHLDVPEHLTSHTSQKAV